MATKILREGESPSASFTLLPQTRTRRGSLTSLASATQPDKEVIAQALDQIHSSASRSGSLTTFNEYTSPPSSSSGPDSKGIGDLQGGISGLYNRFLASVGNVKDVVGPGSDERSSEKGLIESPRASTPASSTSLRDGDDSVRVLQARKEQEDEQINNTTSKRSANDARPPLDCIPSLKPPPTPLKQLGKSPDHSPGPVRAYDQNNDKSRRSQLSDIEPSNAGQAVGEKRHVIGGDNRPSRHAENEERQLHLTLHEDNSTRKPSPILHNEATARSTGAHLPEKAIEDELNPSSQDILSSGQGEINSIGEDKTRRSDKYQHLEIPLRKSLAPPIINRSASPRPSLSRASSTETNTDSVVSTSRHSSSSPVLSKLDHENRNDVARRNLQSYSKLAVLRDPRSMSVFSQVKNKVLNKEYWMKDENARDCFFCGDTFSTFRRKHHCSKRFFSLFDVLFCANDTYKELVDKSLMPSVPPLFPAIILVKLVPYECANHAKG